MVQVVRFAHWDGLTPALNRTLEIEDGQASVPNTQNMPVKVIVGTDESVDVALRKLNRKVQNELSRRWHKRRFGYFEKPSALRRKRKKMGKLSIESGGSLWLKVGLKEQFSRSGSSGAGR